MEGGTVLSKFDDVKYFFLEYIKKRLFLPLKMINVKQELHLGKVSGRHFLFPKNFSWCKLIDEKRSILVVHN